jgi:hypothetical protein
MAYGYRLFLGSKLAGAGPTPPTPPVEQISTIGIPGLGLARQKPLECSLHLRFALPFVSLKLVGPNIAQLSVSFSLSATPTCTGHLLSDGSLQLFYSSEIWCRRRVEKYLTAKELKMRREHDTAADEEEFGE